jgi:PhzF family phenazine biosynthesis protein
MRRRIRHVDAFTSTPLEGNPAAVVDGEGIDGTAMQLIALNQHLSETVFLLRPTSNDNHVHARIFTPAAELPFAGHPIVATAHVLVSEDLVKLREGEPLRIETGAGVIPVEVSGNPSRYTMTQAAPRFRDCDLPTGEMASALGLAAKEIARAEFVNTGIEWLIVQCTSFAAFQKIDPRRAAACPADLAVFCADSPTPGVSVRVRAFAPNGGIPEDPVTGSANGGIAAFIAKHQVLPAINGVIEYEAEQGIEMGQPGRIFARAERASDGLTVRIGGHAVTVLEGELLLPG